MLSVLETIFYLLSVIGLGIAFMCFKKSDKKLNFLRWLIIFIVSFMGYNVTICMILGLLHIKAYLWLLAIINVLISSRLEAKAFRENDLQKYEFPVRDRVAVLLLLILFVVIAVKDIRFQDGGIKFAAIDSAIHYRAAKHFADGLIIFVNNPDKTLFDFNVMQTGAYINDGLLMRITNTLFNMRYEYTYEMFEMMVLFLNLFTFYSLIQDKIKGKSGFILTFIMITLYLYAYPYNSFMYGFSYLSVGVLSVINIINVLEFMYGENRVNRKFIVTLVILNSMLLIFSYCLFVPGIFAGICLYTFIKDFKDEEDDKKILKIFKKNTLIITGILLIVTALGIGYLVVPTFLIANQSNLKDALLNYGGMYKNLVDNFFFYIPFGILFVVDIIRRRKEIFVEKKFTSVEFFTIMIPIFFVVMWVGMRLAIMSTYYFFKLYYILWPVVIATTIDLINRYSENKIGRILLSIYVVLWSIFVIVMVVIKSTNLFPDLRAKCEGKDYVGIYFDQNCNFRGLIQAYNNMAKEQLEVVRKMKELPDVSADNITLISGSYYERCWATAMSEIDSEYKIYQDILQDTYEYTIEDGLNDRYTKYIIRVNESYDLDDYMKNNNVEGKFKVLFENPRGYILEKLDYIEPSEEEMELVIKQYNKSKEIGE